jgi:hypothetical protein
VTRVCDVCHTSFAGRADARACSPRCRQRARRGARYVVTDEDRAAIDRVFARAAHELPPMPTPAQIRAHILATATRE